MHFLQRRRRIANVGKWRADSQKRIQSSEQSFRRLQNRPPRIFRFFRQCFFGGNKSQRASRRRQCAPQRGFFPLLLRIGKRFQSFAMIRKPRIKLNQLRRNGDRFARAVRQKLLRQTPVAKLFAACAVFRKQAAVAGLRDFFVRAADQKYILPFAFRMPQIQQRITPIVPDNKRGVLRQRMQNRGGIFFGESVIAPIICF